MSERSNAQWLEVLAGADGTARTAQLDLHQTLFAALRRALGDRVDAATIEDFVQDAIIKIIAKLPQFRGDSRFTTWAVAIAIRTAYSELRRKRWRDIGLDQLEDHVQQADDGVAVEHSVDRKTIEEVLARVIDTELTPRQRQALEAKVSGMPSAVLCDRLGTNRNALYKLVHDARRAVRQGMIDAGVSVDAVRTAFDL